MLKIMGTPLSRVVQIGRDLVPMLICLVSSLGDNVS